MDLYTLVLALAGIAGFLLESRRDARRDAEVHDRLTALEQRAADLESWRERIGRAQ